MSYDAGSILSVLDDGARNFVFPMLDNGYVYPAAARLSLYRSPKDWAMVFEMFGFSPRAGVPDVCVTTFGSKLTRSKSEADFVTVQAFQDYLRFHPHDEQNFYYPIEDDAWIDLDDGEIISSEAKDILLRGHSSPLPNIGDYEAAGVVLADSSKPRIFEMCRALAYRERGSVLATLNEREASLPQGLRLLLTLDDWHHPDVLDSSVLPSGNSTFQQLAKILVLGEVSTFCPEEASNTHWSNWPAGGTL